MSVTKTNSNPVATVCGIDFFNIDEAMRYAQDMADDTQKEVMFTKHVGTTMQKTFIIHPRNIEPKEAPVQPTQPVEEEMAVNVVGMPEDDYLQTTVTQIQQEINDYFENSGEHQLVERIADWINRSTFAAFEYFSKTAIICPLGADMKPLMPGDIACYRADENDAEQYFKILAIDNLGNIYYNAEVNAFTTHGGTIPTSVSVGMQVTHPQFQNRRDILEWFERQIKDASAEEKQEAYEKVEQLLGMFDGRD